MMLFPLNISFCFLLNENIILICYKVFFLIAGLNKQQQKDMMYWVRQYENGMLFLFVTFSLKFHDFVEHFIVWIFLFTFLFYFLCYKTILGIVVPNFEIVETLLIKKYFYNHYNGNTNTKRWTQNTFRWSCLMATPCFYLH